MTAEIERPSLWAHTQTKHGWHHDDLYETHCHIMLSKQYAAKTELCPQHLTCIEYILTAYQIKIIIF